MIVYTFPFQLQERHFGTFAHPCLSMTPFSVRGIKYFTSDNKLRDPTDITISANLHGYLPSTPTRVSSSTSLCPLNPTGKQDRPGLVDRKTNRGKFEDELGDDEFGEEKAKSVENGGTYGRARSWAACE